MEKQGCLKASESARELMSEYCIGEWLVLGALIDASEGKCWDGLEGSMTSSDDGLEIGCTRTCSTLSADE